MGETTYMTVVLKWLSDDKQSFLIDEVSLMTFPTYWLEKFFRSWCREGELNYIPTISDH